MSGDGDDLPLSRSVVPFCPRFLGGGPFLFLSEDFKWDGVGAVGVEDSLALIMQLGDSAVPLTTWATQLMGADGSRSRSRREMFEKQSCGKQDVCDHQESQRTFPRCQQLRAIPRFVADLYGSMRDIASEVPRRSGQRSLCHAEGNGSGCNAQGCERQRLGLGPVSNENWERAPCEAEAHRGVNPGGPLEGICGCEKYACGAPRERQWVDDDGCGYG